MKTAVETEATRDEKADLSDWNWLALRESAFNGVWDREGTAVPSGRMTIEVGASITITCDKNFPPESVFRDKAFTAEWAQQGGYLTFTYEDYPYSGEDVEYHVEPRGSDGKKRWLRVYAPLGRPETFDAEDGGSR